MLLKGVGEGPSALGIHSRVLEPISRSSQFFFYFLIFSLCLFSFLIPQSFYRYFRQYVFVSLFRPLINLHSFLLHLLQGLQRESKDCEKDHYKNKTRKPNNTKKPSLVSVTISLKQIRRLPGARRSHFIF